MINKKLKNVFLIVVAAMVILAVIVLGRLAWAKYQVNKSRDIKHDTKDPTNTDYFKSFRVRCSSV